MSVKGLHSPREAFLHAVRDADAVSCRVPGAEDPVDLAGGLRWLEASLKEGFAVDFRVVRSDGEVEVSLVRWDEDERQPDWPEEWPDPDEMRGAV